MVQPTQCTKNLTEEDVHTLSEVKGAQPLYGALSQRGLDPIKLAQLTLARWPGQINSQHPDLSQYASRPGRRALYCTRLNVSSSVVA